MYPKEALKFLKIGIKMLTEKSSTNPESFIEFSGDQGWNRYGFFMTDTGTGPKTSDRNGSAGRQRWNRYRRPPGLPVDWSREIYR